MVSLEEEPEISMMYENFEDVSARNAASCRSVEDVKVPAAASGMKINRLVVVSFGLLCILQAALNISLRLTLYLEAGWNNLTEENHGLKRTLKEYGRYNGWMYFSGSLYKMSSIKKNWQESRDDCLQKGADLVIINSQEEQDYIVSFRKRVWIGLTDQETEGRWKWVDGTPLTTRFTHYFTFLLSSYWYTDEPNGSSKLDEDCAEIIVKDVRNSWNDYHCSNIKNGWICEKRLP